MNNSLKQLILSLMIVLAFALPQCFGIELVGEKDTQKRKVESSDLGDNFKNLKKQKVSNNTTPADVIQTPSHSNGDFVKDDMIVTQIVKYVAIEHYLRNDYPVNLALVCRSWNGIIRTGFTKDNDCWKAWYGIIGHEKEYAVFLNCVLLSQTNYARNDWSEVYKIRDFPDPFRGNFILPEIKEFGALDNLFCIKTGIPRTLCDEYKGIIVVWFCPRFYMQKWLDTSRESQLKQIMDHWGPEFTCGYFWTYDGTGHVITHMTNWDINSKLQHSLADMIGRTPIPMEHFLEVDFQHWLITINIMTRFSIFNNRN